MAGIAMVTGANGHVGYNLVRTLTARGNNVRATVRNRDDPKTAGPLQTLANVETESLDVRDGQAFEKVSEGVDTLFHLAATYRFRTSGPSGDEEMIRDSVEGARAAILAAARNGISKVILTSSIVTLPFVRLGEPKPTEADWRSDLSVPYYRAKVLGERAAWQLAEEHNVDLVTILPGFVLGPPFLRRTTSLDMIEAMMLGVFRFGTPDASLPAPIDVRDLAEALVLAAEKPSEGRFIVANDDTMSFLELTRLMHRIDQTVPRAPFILPDFVFRFTDFIDWFNARTLGAPRVFTAETALASLGMLNIASSEKARRELGWTPKIPFEQTLAETMAALKELRAVEKGARTTSK
jgi:dihydroflavonol-4-reductase